MGRLVWKIVIPDTLFSSDEGLLCGFLLTSKEFMCVSSVTKYEKYFSSTSGDAKQFQCLGYWHGTKFKEFTFEDRESVKTAHQESMVWVDIYLSAEGRPRAVFRFRDSLRTDPLQIGVATCLVFNPSELLSSYILRDVDQRVLLKSSKDPNEDMTTNLGTLVYVLHQHLLQNSTKKAQNEAAHVKDLIQKCSQRGFAGVCVLKIAAFLSWVYLALGKLLDNRFMDNQYLKPVVNHVAFFHQIELRYLQVKQCNNMAPTEKLQEIRCLNVKTRLILDMVLGLLLMMFLMWSGAADVTAAYIITWADAVVVWLNQLLDWLMGVPAGLKLNSQLDQFLGRFFHYHIYLWTGYLSLLKPVLSPLLWYASMVGVLGLSAQLCLLQDIFSTLTVHIYCFYVYAARLYYFQLYGLSSMWRLFRGKKWNVLRRRVDSASYDVDQLFVGTLLFTILLFLLPTTALYYVVFLGLRLLVLSLTGMVSKAVSLINTLPIHMLLLRLFRSPKAAGDVMLTVLPHQGQRENLFVALQTIQVPYSHLISSLTEENARIDSLPRYTWASLLRRVLAGELIYPWVEPAVQSRKLQ